MGSDSFKEHSSTFSGFRSLLEVQVLDGQGNLEDVELSLSLAKLCHLNDLVKQLPALRKLQHNEEKIGCADLILLVQHAGGAVAAVEGDEDCVLASDSYCNPVQA